jgi:aspartate/methionine/tyrosine aminotransferase
VPVFWLNGLSKTVGNPHLKLSWMVFKAPEDQFEKIREALTFVADAYLSVSSGAQAAALDLLPKADSIQEIPKMSRAIRVSGSMFSLMPKRLMKMAIIMLSNKSRTKSTLSQK